MNGCHGRAEFCKSTKQQDGWTEDGRRNMVDVPAVMNPNCQYSSDKLVGRFDANCAGCPHRSSNPPQGTRRT